MQFVRGLLRLGFALFGLAVVVVTLLLYLGVNGQSPPVLGALADRIAAMTAGQHIDQMVLSVDVDPAARRLRGVARLVVSAIEDGRDRIYLLLNDGLTVERAWLEGDNGETTPLRHTQLWVLTALELPRPLDREKSVRLGLSYSGNPLEAGVSAAGAVLEADEIILQASHLWYPIDLQSFSRVDVEITLPANLNLIHNGAELRNVRLGSSRQVRWTSARLVPGVALVAGRQVVSIGEREGARYRVFLPPDTKLEGERILDALMTSERDLSSYFGRSDFPHLTLFSSRRLLRAFFDGSGVIGIGAGDFRGGDYGYSVVAHEVAHSWWGATVAGKWLEAGTGGEWIVEGFSQLSAWRAVRSRFGEDAAMRSRLAAFFDPAAAKSVVQPSALDNLTDPGACGTIYGKGAFVAYMLQQRMGEEPFGAAARHFLTQFRFRSATAADLEEAFEEQSGQNLAPFFADWVYSDSQLDLSLNPEAGAAVVHNNRSAAPAETITLWRAPPGAQPVEQSVALGASTPVGNVERLVLDPQAQLADMYRSNNALPLTLGPRAIERSPSGALLVVEGEPYPWAPARIREIDSLGATRHAWDLERGLLAPPSWSADGSRVVAVEAGRGGPPSVFALHSSDGGQRLVGHDTVVSGTANGLVAARDGRLLSIESGDVTILVDVERGRVVAPRASAGAGRVAYGVVDGARMELRVVDTAGGDDRLLLTWARGPLRWRWSPDGSRLFAVLGGDWDWQLWEIPLDDTPRALVREAAAIRDIAVSPDGKRIAFVAQAKLDFGIDRFEAFVIDRGDDREVRRYNLGGNNGHSVAWLDDENLLVIVSDPTYPTVPSKRELRRLQLADSSLHELR
jgi:hypothetical protein